MLSPKTDHLSDVEVQKLLDATDRLVKEKPEKAYLRPIVLFALNTGIRIKSLVQLEWRDVVLLDEDGGELHIRAACIKTRKDENISLSAAAASVLRTLYKAGHAETDRIFTTYTVEYINKSIKKLLLDAGLGKYSAYSLRHNYATSLYLAGASPVEIQIQMCHRSFRTTQIYPCGLRTPEAGSKPAEFRRFSENSSNGVTEAPSCGGFIILQPQS